MSMRHGFLLLVTVLPWSIRKYVLTKLFGYEFQEGARIGFAMVDARTLSMGRNSSIGSFTVIRNLKELRLEDGAKIGTFNWIFGMLEQESSFSEETNRTSALVLREHAAITSRHLIDCIDRVEIGSYATIAGYRSQFLTHSIDISRNRQSCAPIVVGSYCFIGTGVTILKGTTVPERCVVAAASVVTKSLPEENCLYGGNPARLLRRLDGSEKYFHRLDGSVV